MKKLKNWLRSLFKSQWTQDLEDEVAILNNQIYDLLEERKDPEAYHLRKYIEKTCSNTLTQCEDLLGSDEALKHFGKMMGEYKADTMMMFTAMEYEFINNYDFTEDQLKVLRHFIGNTGLFFKGCKEQHEAKVALQHKK